MRIMKLVTLAAVAVVAAACNGTSPMSPGATIASDAATAVVDAKALGVPEDCSGITQVQMLLLRDEGPEFRVEAVYLEGGKPARCRVAPIWSSRPRGRLVPTRDPFVVKVTRTTPPTPATVTAQAPNGLQGIIRVPER